MVHQTCSKLRFFFQYARSNTMKNIKALYAAGSYFCLICLGVSIPLLMCGLLLL